MSRRTTGGTPATHAPGGTRTPMDAFITQHLLGVSRTYAVVIPMLPPPLAEPVGLAYLLMRIVDTLEDAPDLSAAERLHRFDRLEAALRAPGAPADPILRQPIGESAAERALLDDAPAVLARIHALEPARARAIIACAERMIGGVREFMARSAARGAPYPAIGTPEELRSYCYYVAGVVGEMLCELTALHLDQPTWRGQRSLAVELGTGLQLVNILKDCQQDARQGRRYLPPSTGGAAPEADIRGAVLGEARRCLARGTEYVLALPARETGLRAFCGLPIVWGALTLSEVARPTARPKITRAAVTASVARFQQVAGDDAALRRWFDELLPADQFGSTTSKSAMTGR